MKKFFFTVAGISFGVVMALSLVLGGRYWWLFVRIPSPPDLAIEIDGLLGDQESSSEDKRASIRIVLTNNGNSNIELRDAYLYLTRPSDGARANISFKVDDILIFPKEKYVEVVETFSLSDKSEWFNAKSADEFESDQAYIEHRQSWINQVREEFNFNYTFVSSSLNIRTPLDVQAFIDDLAEN